MGKNVSVDFKKVTFNLPIKTINEVHDYAKSIGMPITQTYLMLIRAGLRQEEIFKTMPELFCSLRDLKETVDATNKK